MKKFIKHFLFVLITCSAGIISGQETDWKSLIESWRQAFNVPGMSVGIIKDGKIIFSEGFGVLEEGKNAKVDEQTLFSIASNTKAFTAASLAQLVDEGKISWDDRVRKYLPYFELYDPCVSDMMTIRDLLTHRAGLGTFSGDVIWYRSNYTAEEVVKHAAAIPKAFEYRSGYGYSNVMYIAAGEVIRSVTGKKWSAYVKENFLTPLGMNRTLTSTDQLPGVSNVARPHKPVKGVEKPIDWVNWDNMGAAGGIISSANDMLKWMGMQLNRGIIGKDTFFTTTSQNAMWSVQNSFPVSTRAHELFGRNFSGYGFAWSLNDYKGHFAASHTGGYDGMYSSVYLLPYDKIGVVVLTNSMHSIGPMLTFEILDRLLGNPATDWKDRGLKQDAAGFADRDARIKERTDARQLGTIPSMTHEEFTGLYRDNLYGEIRLSASDQKLFIDFLASPGLKAELTHWHDDTYQINWINDQAWFDFGTVQILKDNNGKPSGLQFDIPNDDIFFEEIKSEREGE